MRDLEVLSARLPLTEAGRIEAELRAAGATVLDVTWSDDVEIRIGVEPGRSAPFDSLVAACTQGVSRFRIVGTSRVEVDGPSPES